MTEICEITNMVRDIWNWSAERWLYFTVIGIVYLLIYYASGSPIQAAFGILLLICMWLGILWVDRLPRDDQIFWKRLVGFTVILLAITVAITFNPVSALTITGEPAGDQIHWEIVDGEPPYTVFVNGVEIVSGYPATVFSTDSEPGRQYTAVVLDNETVADATVTGEYYTYPMWVWLLFAALIGCLIVSIWLPYAAFGAAIAGGFLLLLIAPNPDYAPYLRIFAGAAFIVGLAGIAGRLQ